MIYKNIEEANPFVKPYPTYEDVFADKMQLHEKHFLPLVSVDASVIDDDLPKGLRRLMRHMGFAIARHIRMRAQDIGKRGCCGAHMGQDQNRALVAGLRRDGAHSGRQSFFDHVAQCR